MADENSNVPAANDEGFLHSLATSLGIDPDAVKSTAKAIYEHPVETAKQVGGEVAAEAADIAAHPIESAKDVGRGIAAQAGVNPEAQATAKTRFAQPGLGNKAAGALEYVTSGVPLVGGNLVKSEEQAAQGNIAGATGTAVGTVVPILTEAEPVQAAKAHLAETGKTFVASAKEGLNRAVTATAPEGSLEAGFAKIGGKKVKDSNTGGLQHVYRARPVGQEGIGTESHAQATTSRAEAKGYASNLEDMTGKPHEVVRVDLNKLEPEKYTRAKGPNGNDWIKFHEPVDEKLVEKTEEPPEEKYEQTLAARGQLPGQTVNMAPAYGETGQYRGGLVKSRGEQAANALSAPNARGLKEHSTGDDKIDDHIKTAGAIPAGTTVGDQVMFHDPITGSTLTLPRDQATSPQAVRDQITASRAKYGMKPAPQYHPDLQKLIDNETTKHGGELHQDASKVVTPGAATFITPDGKYLSLKGITHDKAIAEATTRSSTDDGRIGFINDTGAIRVRQGTDRTGNTLHVSVPKSGATAEQVDALKQVVAKTRYGNLQLERADVGVDTRDELTHHVEMARSADVDAGLKKIQAHPEQKATEAKISVDNNGVKWAEGANGVRVSIPKRIAAEDVQKYAADQIEKQQAGQAAAKANRVEPNETLQGSAQKYAKKQGMEPINHEPVKVDPERAKEIANIYDKAQHDPENPRVKSAYDAMKKETLAQFHHLRDDLGLKFEPQEQDPYSSAGEMMGDIKQNNRLKVWNQADLQSDHPMAEIAPGTGGQTYNTVFRWVHDSMGHAAGGNDFSEAGEKSATEAHAQMYSDVARPAMRNETEGQTSWFFHNPEVESGAKQPGEFPGNKATILPDTSADWHEKAGASAAKDEAGGINPRTGKSDSKGMGTEIMPELRQPLDHAPTAQDFKNFYDQHKDIFDAHPELRVGWDNKSAVDGGHEINVGAVGPDAARVAKKLDQKAAFDIGKGNIVPTGGTGLRTQFPNYPIEERIKDLTNTPHSTRAGFEHLSDDVYKNLEPDERKYVEGNKTLQRNVMAQYHRIAPSVAETTNAMQAGAALGGWWQRYIDTFHGLLDTDAEKVANTIGPSHAEVLKQWHAALSANKSVQDANNLAWHSYADWLDAGKPTDRKSINDIVLKNGAQPEGSGKKGNAAISDTLGKRGKIIHEGIDTSKLYNLVNSPEMRGERPFSGDVFNNDETNPLMGKGEGYRKVPSMGATVAGKGNLNRLVIDTHIADFYGQSVKGTAARYIADSAHLRQAAKALGLKGGEGQEQLWGTVLGLKTLLKEGLTPAEAGGKLNAETINQIGKDYAEVIANDPEITQPGGLLDRLKEKYGIGVGSAGAGAADSAARSTRAGEGQPAGSQAPVDPALLGESARRIRGQISDSKIKKPTTPEGDEDTSFEFGANVKPKTPSPKHAGKSSATMSAMELIQALSGLSKPGSKK